MGSFSLDSCRIQTVCLIYRQRLDCLHSSSLLFGLLAVSCRSCTILFSFFVFSPRLPFSRFSFLVPRSQFDTTALLSQSIHTFFLPFSLSSVGSSFSLLFRSSVPRRLHVHLLLISGWVHLSRTHAGFRWCASFIGSVLTVLLSCRQVLALIVPSRTRIHH